VPDSSTANPGRGNPDEVLAISPCPRLNAGREGISPFSLIIDVMRGSLNQDAPAFVRFSVEVIDLERHAVLGMLYAGAQIFIRGTRPGRPEQDRAVMQHVVDRKHSQVETAGKGEPADAAWCYQPKTLFLVEYLELRI
jgi:hypothetical protein